MALQLGLTLAGVFDSQFDPDAIAFLGAAGLTDAATCYAINDLVTGLKLNGLWTLMSAIYPFAGSTATTQKWNLKDPRDLDAAYRLTFSGGWTHSSNGALGNGTNSYADTFYSTSSVTQNDTSLGFYARVNYTPPASAAIDMGSFNEGTGFGIFLAAEVVTNIPRLRMYQNAVDSTGTNQQGFWIGAAGSDTRLIKDGAVLTTAANSGTFPLTARNISLGAMYSTQNSVYAYYTAQQYAFAFIGTNLTNAQALTFTSLVQRYQNALSRAIVAIPTVQDLDAQNFLVAAAITDSTQAQAVQDLTAGLKTYSLWSKLQAIYPFVGSTATTQKWNLKDPRDADAAYRLTFSGGWTHASTGATPNGTNAYASTFFAPTTNGNQNSLHISFYSRTDATAANVVDMGSEQVSGGRYTIIQSKIPGPLYFGMVNDATGNSVSNSNSQGFYIANRTGSAVINHWKNGIKIVSGTQVSGTNTTQMAIGALASSGSPSVKNYSTKETAFATIGTGLTDSDALSLTSVIQRFQTALSRAIVAVPTVQDIDAQNFLVAASITDSTQATALQNLTLGLKTNSLWDKMDAVYPFLGSTSSTQKFNLKSPYDADASFRLTFTGGWTHASTGALPNGTNGYANTYYIPNTSGSLNDAHASIYLRTNTAVNAKDFGVSQGSPTRQTYVSARDTSNAQAWGLNSGSVDVGNQANSQGLWTVTRTDATNVLGYKNSTLLNTNALASSARPTVAYYFGAFNNNGTAQQFSNREFAWVSFGLGLSSTNISNLYTVVQAYETALSRQV